MRPLIHSKTSARGWALTAACASGLLVCPPAILAQDDPKAPTPYVVVTAGQERYEVPLQPEGKTTGFNHVIETADYQINISGTLDPDPSIAYAIGIVDFGAPSIFGFLFGTPIVPTGPGTTVSASIVGGLTDFTGDGVSLTPTGPKVQTSSVGFPSTSMGVDVGDPAIHGPGPAGAFYTYGAFADGPDPGPVGAWTFLTTSSMFALSGGGDAAALTGFASVVTSVPDGGAGLLSAMAILGVLFAGRRARKNARV